MRYLVIAAMLVCLLNGHTLPAQESVTTVDLISGEANPEDAQHIQNIKGPTRTMSIVIRHSGTDIRRTQRVRVTGSLSREQVVSLAQAVLGTDDIYWAAIKYPFDVSITGDEYRTRIDRSYDCGGLCGSGISYFYSYDQAGWRYLYSCDSWIS